MNSRKLPEIIYIGEEEENDEEEHNHGNGIYNIHGYNTRDYENNYSPENITFMDTSQMCELDSNYQHPTAIECYIINMLSDQDTNIDLNYEISNEDENPNEISQTTYSESLDHYEINNYMEPMENHQPHYQVNASSQLANDLPEQSYNYGYDTRGSSESAQYCLNSGFQNSDNINTNQFYRNEIQVQDQYLTNYGEQDHLTCVNGEQIENYTQYYSNDTSTAYLGEHSRSTVGTNETYVTRVTDPVQYTQTSVIKQYQVQTPVVCHLHHDKNNNGTITENCVVTSAGEQYSNRNNITGKESGGYEIMNTSNNCNDNRNVIPNENEMITYSEIYMPKTSNNQCRNKQQWYNDPSYYLPDNQPNLNTCQNNNAVQDIPVVHIPVATDENLKPNHNNNINEKNATLLSDINNHYSENKMDIVPDLGTDIYNNENSDNSQDNLQNFYCQSTSYEYSSTNQSQSSVPQQYSQSVDLATECDLPTYDNSSEQNHNYTQHDIDMYIDTEHQFSPEENEGQIDHDSESDSSQLSEGKNDEDCEFDVPSQVRIRHNCPMCKYTTMNDDNLANHMLLHAGVKPYKCSYCDYSARQSTNLKQHMLTHTGNKPFKCKVCPYRVANAHSLRIHMSKHTGHLPYQCHVCTYNTSRLQLLKQHMIQHKGQALFKCNFCKFTANTRKQLTKHSSTHMKNPLKCMMCDYTTSYPLNLGRHLAMHSEKKSLKCHYCPYITTHAGNMNAHAMTHTGEKPYRCSMCNYRATQRSSIEKHMTVHYKKMSKNEKRNEPSTQ